MQLREWNLFEFGYPRLHKCSIGIVLEIAGSGSAIALDLQRLQECTDDLDPSVALAGQVGSQVKIRVGKGWLLARLANRPHDS